MATPRPIGTSGRPPGSSARPAGSTVRPSSATRPRAGRRERQRTAYQPSFFERFRTPIILLAGAAGVILLVVFVLFSASQPAYACSSVWTPAPTPAPTAGATPDLGYVQPDMGHLHAAVGNKVTYTYCPPASGMHYNVPGTAGPIPARLYGPSDAVLPEGWIHNLEHGALVILYQGTSAGATADGQAAFRTFYDNFPPSPVCGLPKGQLGPVIARFDQMATPFTAIVWGRELPLQTFDQAQIMAFWNQWGERTNGEPQCAAPSSSPTVSFVPDTSGAPSPS
jgi:hypothetical protein